MRTLLLTLTTCLLVLPVQAKYSGGSGTAQDPYQIATAADLILLGETPADYGKHFVLTADIDLDPNLPGRKVFDKAVIAADTDPVKDYYQGVPFTGLFDGNGHTISCLTIRGGSRYLGLFGRVASGADVKDLGVVDVRITGSGDYVGALVGSNGEWDACGGIVRNCYSTGAVTGNSVVGGLVGSNSCGSGTRRGIVRNCYSTCLVKGNDRVGGLAGHSYWGYVTYCYSTGVVSGNSGVGGLVGENNWGTVTQCYSTGTVSGDGGVGGLVGDNYGGSVAQCYSTGAVTGNSVVGGLVGYNGDYGTVTQCYSTGSVISSDSVGGLVGNNQGDVTGCFWDTQSSGRGKSAGGTGLTTAQMQDIQAYVAAGWDWVGEMENGTHEVWQMPEAGGYPILAILSGYAPPRLQGLGTADDPYLIARAVELGAMMYYSPDAHYRLAASIDLSGIRWGMAVIPRFAGTFDGSGHTISHLRIQGGSYLGLFGQLDSGAEVKDLGLVDVNITGSGGYIGGLAAENVGTVTQCYSTGAVSGSAYAVGGLVASNDSTVTQCYSTASVSGDSGVGGLVGDNDGQVTCCYSTGAVHGRDGVGGLIGDTYSGMFVCAAASFWDTQTSGQSKSAGGTGKTTAQMQTARTFLTATGTTVFGGGVIGGGWDFVDETANGTEDLWWILEGKDYPRLWWEAAKK